MGREKTCGHRKNTSGGKQDELSTGNNAHGADYNYGSPCNDADKINQKKKEVTMSCKKRKAQPLLRSKRGMEMVQVAILVAIAVTLGLIFKTQITDFVNDTFSSLSTAKF